MNPEAPTRVQKHCGKEQAAHRHAACIEWPRNTSERSDVLGLALAGLSILADLKFDFLTLA